MDALPPVRERISGRRTADVAICGIRTSLHDAPVPVKEVVQDASGIKERIAAERNVCGVQFGTKDVFAAASVLTADGKETAVRYFKGGNRYSLISAGESWNISTNPTLPTEKMVKDR